MSIYPRRNFLIRSELYSSRRARCSIIASFRISRFTILNDGNRDRISSPVAKTDLLHSFLPYCVFFLRFFFPPESFFASLCIFLFCLLVFLSFSPRSSRCHVIPQFRWLPPPSSCRRLQQWQTAATAAATRAHASISTLARAHTRAHGRGTSPFRVRSAYRWIRMSRR